MSDALRAAGIVGGAGIATCYNLGAATADDRPAPWPHLGWRCDVADDIPDRSTVKTCTECGQPKPLDSFSPSRLGKHGRRSKCRECCRTLASAYRAANPERARASVNAYHVANHDGILAQKRAYYAANREAER